MALALVLSFSSCQAISSFTSGPLGSALSGIQGLTGDIGKWSNMLGTGDISDKVLGQLAGFSDKTGGLGDMLKKALTGAGDDVQKKVAPVQDGLKKLGGLNAQNLMGLDQGERRNLTNQFSADSSGLSDMIGKLLGS